MASMALRMFATLAGLLLAIHAGHYPARPTGVLLMPFYFSALVAECAFLVRLMGRLGEPGKGN
jgi:hypothetical protein